MNIPNLPNRPDPSRAPSSGIRYEAIVAPENAGRLALQQAVARRSAAIQMRRLMAKECRVALATWEDEGGRTAPLRVQPSRN